MIHSIRLFVSKNCPGKYNEILRIYLGIKKIHAGLIIILDSLRTIFFKSKLTVFPSVGMTVTSVFRENAILFLSVSKDFRDDIYWLGKINKNRDRFALFLDDNQALEKALCDIVRLGGNLSFLNKTGLNKLVTGNEILWQKKIRKYIKTSIMISIYKVYRNSQNVVEFSSLYSTEVEIWRSKNRKIYKTNANNRIQNIINLDRVSIDEVKRYGFTVKQFLETKRYNSYIIKKNIKKIDIVYAWVDGTDKSWCDKKQKYLDDKIQKKVNDTAFAYSRYISRDELKYSLRSVYKYLDYVDNIYIVTDGQRPSWLNESSKIRIVDHKDIFPDISVLPVFNSHAIETCLHRIEGLSEHYLYLNDDIIFGRYVPLNIFFPQKGKINIFPSSQTFIQFGDVSKEDLPVDSAAKNTRSLFYELGLIYPVNKFKHTPIPQIKSMMFELEDLFKEEVDKTRASRFRQPSDISMASSLFYHFAMSRDCASIANLRYTYIKLGEKKYYESMLRLLADNDYVKFDVFCVNDQLVDVSCENKVTNNFHEVMEQLYHEKGVFES